MKRFAKVVVFLAALAPGVPALADQVVGGAKAPQTSGGTVSVPMKWTKLPGEKYACKSNGQDCICQVGSDVIDCRKATGPGTSTPPVKKAD